MRVITGKARGVRLKTLEGLDVRPTTEKVKEAIFSAIQFEMEGRRFLDLFAGSGQMGIEALSRGAAFCVFVDKNRSAIQTVQDNLRKTGLMEQAAVRNQTAESFLASNTEPFDLAFLDPPYHNGVASSMLPLLEGQIRPGGAVICETAQEEEMPEAVGSLQKYREYHYSKITVTIYRK